jgi:N-methylhydantoinase A
MRFQGEIFPEAPVFERSRLTHSDEVPGPAVIEQFDATLVVPPGFVARVGAYGTILMTRS